MYDVKVEKRIRSSARASGRVAAGIGSSLEIAVGWFPHRLEQFIRGFLGGQSGERAVRRRPEAGENRLEKRITLRTRIIPVYVLELTIGEWSEGRKEGKGEREREKEGKNETEEV